MPIVDRFNVDGQDYSIEPVLDAVPIQNSQHAVMSGGVFADKSNVPVQGSTKNFTAAGAYDFFFNSATKMEWAGKVLGSQLGQGWARAVVGDPTPGPDTPPSLAFGVFAYGNGVWVAGTTDACWKGAYYSLDDGATWQKSDLPNYGTWAAEYADGKFVLGTGHLISSDNDNGGLWYSTDGQHWIQSNIDTAAVRDVKYYNGVWVSTTTTGVYYSSDGEYWQLASGTSGESCAGICPNKDGTKWIVGGIGKVFYSTDNCETFTPRGNFSSSTIPIYSIAYSEPFGEYDEGMWVCFPQTTDGTAQSPQYSVNGLYWTFGTGAPTFTNIGFYSILYSKKDDLWVGVCQGYGSSVSNKGILYSEDGRNFYYSDAPATTTTYYYAVRYANGVYFASCMDTANTNSGLYRSTDGKHWTKVLDTKTTTGLFYANGTWVHSGSDPVSNPTGIIKRSSVDMLVESLT